MEIPVYLHLCSLLKFLGIFLNKNVPLFLGVARQSAWQYWINSSFAGWKKLKAELPKGKTERVTPYISAFIYVPLITAPVCLYYAGNLTVVVLLHLQGAKVSISRNYALKSIIKYLEFLIEIPGSPGDKSQRERRQEDPLGNALLQERALRSCAGTSACLGPTTEPPGAPGWHPPALQCPASENGPRWRFWGVVSNSCCPDLPCASYSHRLEQTLWPFLLPFLHRPARDEASTDHPCTYTYLSLGNIKRTNQAWKSQLRQPTSPSLNLALS